MTTTNSKMTNDWLEFDYAKLRRNNDQLKRDSAVQQIEQRNREIAEQEMAEDLARHQARMRYELAEQKRKERIRQRYAAIHAQQAKLPSPSAGTVTGILYSEDKPSAVVNGRIVHIGDTIHGVKVVKIHQEKLVNVKGKHYSKRLETAKVEFEKNGIRWTQGLQEPPAPYWE